MQILVLGAGAWGTALAATASALRPAVPRPLLMASPDAALPAAMDVLASTDDLFA